jgi:hypothetical protein
MRRSARLRVQVLSNLIDETLQIQEAAANKITIDRAEVDQSFARAGNQFKLHPTAVRRTMIRKAWLVPQSLKRQIEGEMAWRRLLSREVEPFVSVSDEEVNQVIARMQAAKGAPEFHVSEIFLSATPLPRISRWLPTRSGSSSNCAKARPSRLMPANIPKRPPRPLAAILAGCGPSNCPMRSAAPLRADGPRHNSTGPLPVGGGYSIHQHWWTSARSSPPIRAMRWSAETGYHHLPGQYRQGRPPSPSV